MIARSEEHVVQTGNAPVRLALVARTAPTKNVSTIAVSMEFVISHRAFANVSRDSLVWIAVKMSVPSNAAVTASVTKDAATVSQATLALIAPFSSVPKIAIAEVRATIRQGIALVFLHSLERLVIRCYRREKLFLRRRISRRLSLCLKSFSSPITSTVDC